MERIKQLFGRQLARDGALLAVGDAGARLLAFIASAHLAVVLGPESFGTITIGLTILSYLTWVGDIGLAPLAVREFALEREERSMQLGDFLWLRTILGILAGVLGAAIIVGVIDDPVTRSVSLLFLLAIVPAIWQIDWYFQGRRRYGPIALVRYIFNGLYLLGIWLLVTSEEDLLNVPLIYIAAILPAACTAILLRAKEDPIAVPPPVRRNTPTETVAERWRDGLRRAAPIGFGGLLAQSVPLLPPLVLAAIYDEYEAGLFGGAFRLAVTLMVIDRIFIALYFPRISNLYRTDRERYGSEIRRSFRLLLLGNILLAVVLVLAAPILVDLILDESYRSAVPAFAILGCFVPFTLFNSLFSYGLIAAGIERPYLRSSIISTTIATMLIVILSWTSGVTGAAIGVTLGEGIMAFLMYREFRRHVGIPIW